MAAALKTRVHSPVQTRWRASQPDQPRKSGPLPPSPRSVVPLRQADSGDLVRLSPPKPAGRLATIAYQASSVVTAIAVVMALGGYGYSVHVNRQLSRSESRLAQLQRSEDQLTTANEVLKNHMAEQVQQSNTGLTPPRLGNVLFLRPAPLSKSSIAPPSQAISLPRQPLSY